MKEYQPKIDAAADAAKAALNTELEAKKAEKGKEFDDKIAGLVTKKAEDVKKAQEADVKAAADKKAADEKALKDCSDKCVKDGFAKKLVECQMKAADAKAFGECK